MLTVEQSKRLNKQNIQRMEKIQPPYRPDYVEEESEDGRTVFEPADGRGD